MGETYPPRYRRAVADILGLDDILTELVLGLGLALLVGNGFAIFQHLRGRRPADATGGFRTGRVAFLMAVGFVMALWGGISTFTG
jgi:hypothetical protein